MARGVVSVLVFTAIFLSGTHTALRMQGVPTARYSIRDLGTFGGTLTSALATTDAAIGGSSEDQAWVAGYSRTTSNVDHAFVYHQGELRDIGTLGGTTSVARSVNWDGHVVGESRNRSGVNRAFLYANGSMQDLGALYATGQSFARSINGYGEVVGGSQTTASADSTRAFIYRNGAMSLLGTTFGGTKSVANAINGPGQVVGSAYTTGNASYRAFLYDGGVTRNLGTLGGTNSEATSLNELGHVVGRSQITGSSAQHAFLYRDGSLRDLGTLGGANSEALDINYLGDVVGSSQIAGSSTYHAFIWRNGRMTDLNTLLPADSGWVLERASGITYGGQIVGRGRFGGQTRAFVMLPPVDVRVANFGYNDLDGNLPRPVQTGRTISWVLFVTNQSDGGRSATNVTVTDTLSGAVEYVSVAVEGANADACRILGRTLECHFERIEDGSFGPFVQILVRPTAAGEFGHTVRITHADQDDPDPSNNQYSESNLAISLAALTLKPATVAGGKAVGVNVTLTSPHPHGASVRMTSSNPAVAPVPPTFVHVFDVTRSFNIVPAVVSSPTTVQISATYGLVTRTATLTVLPPALSALQLTPTTVIGGCGTIAARVSLTGAAPASGAAVSISEALAAARFPTSLVVPAGALIHTFTIPTNWVTAAQSGPVTATYGGASRPVTLTVRPVRARSVALTPNPVRGGAAVTGVVTLECAPPSPVVVSLSSGNSAVASPAVSSITIPAGQLSGSFQLRTLRVTAPTSVPVYTRIYGVRQTATLTVNP
jgi:uncharacterized repeat protein (TIGR01451 family)